jgi:hypothetical protein
MSFTNISAVYSKKHEKYSRTPSAKRVKVKLGRNISDCYHCDLQRWFWNHIYLRPKIVDHIALATKRVPQHPISAITLASLLCEFSTYQKANLWFGNPRFKVLIISLHSDCISREEERYEQFKQFYRTNSSYEDEHDSWSPMGHRAFHVLSHLLKLFRNICMQSFHDGVG